MIEVFKTNVNDEIQASNLVRLIHITFQDYLANFDLEDCDRILRVRSISGEVDSSLVIGILRQWGWSASILPDEPPADVEKDFIRTLLCDEA